MKDSSPRTITPSCPFPVALLISVLCCFISPAQAAEVLSPQAKLFQSKEVPINAQGVRHVLAGLLPAEDGNTGAEDLIAQLGAAEFAARVEAEKKILALPIPPLDQLKLAQVGKDPEIRMRATKLLKKLAGQKPEQDLFLFASLLLIRDEVKPGMTEDLLKLAPHCKRLDLCLASWEAMRRTVSKEDQSLLVKALQSENRLTRAMAWVGLQSLTGGDQRQLSQELLEEEHSELVQLALAWAQLDEKVPADKLLLKKLSQSKQELVQQLAQRALEQMENRDRKADWSDYLAAKLIKGKHGGQYTQFVQEVSPSLMEILPHEKRRANTIGPVSGRHGSDPWLYPEAGKNEAPRVLEEEGLRYYPVYGTWKQQWGSHWNTLDENGNQLGESLGRGAHMGSVVEYLCWPISPE